MEGGVDEELDYDATEDFQDDDENNTFYHDQEEEEETKYQEVSYLDFGHELIARNKSRKNSAWQMLVWAIDPRSITPMMRMICLGKGN